MSIKKKFLLLALIVVAAGLYPASQHVALKKDTSVLVDTLTAIGLAADSLPEPVLTQNSTVVPEIKLDTDGFSTIRALTITGGLRGLLSAPAPATLTIDDLRLMGAYSAETGLEIGGWRPVKTRIAALPDIILNGGQLDISTPEGALRLQAKGQSILQSDGTRKLQALMWANQNQLRFDTGLTGTARETGDWSYTLEVRQAAVNFKKMQASRISGWLSLDGRQGAVPALGGQIDAGKFTYGAITLGNFNLAIEGGLNDYRIALRGDIAGFGDMKAAADLFVRTPGETQISATVQSRSAADMIALLRRLAESDIAGGSLASLLLTAGNIARIEQEIAQASYDSLELQIAGPAEALSGKIIAKTNGAAPRIISLSLAH